MNTFFETTAKREILDPVAYASPEMAGARAEIRPHLATLPPEFSISLMTASACSETSGPRALTGKPNAILTVGKEEPNPAEDYVKAMFRSNYMASPIGILRARGIAQCYTCGYGQGCSAGAVVSRHGFLDEIRGYHIPRIPQETYEKATVLAKRLGTIVKTNA